MATRYRRRDVSVEAMQWDGTVENATAIIQWVLDGDGTARYREARCIDPDVPERAMLLPHYIALDAKDGTVSVDPTDYISWIDGAWDVWDAPTFELQFEAT